MTDRLTRQDWILHGFATLKQTGPDGLKADRMVKALNVSRGSFYWHFKNIDDFNQALLTAWRTQITGAVIADLKDLPDGPAQIRDLIHRALTTPQELEAAMRHWANATPAVAKAVTEVDTLRIGYLDQTFRQMGQPVQIARASALLLHWAYVGRAVAPAADPDEIARHADNICRLLFPNTKG
ncbi:TetR/AcrR family transcriptional regulator [Actibacterium sp. 188UL27-1]|uniref:TetR/AcrR family transcriptional regulator n=1 Tax=Actibacterium sp. 188UL27-1 TaxID=2786961 RepID=UPI001956E24F|nr:TetR/AcrR family transcriptional regulator [Actibacterium sp. 188UL27-1]MBM7068260.1 TetR/AcrR family transcriptional regulator [Actibacterium sp. 188UL27-1]